MLLRTVLVRVTTLSQLLSPNARFSTVESIDKPLAYLCLKDKIHFGQCGTWFCMSPFLLLFPIKISMTPLYFVVLLIIQL